jgi:hypothetical protein
MPKKGRLQDKIPETTGIGLSADCTRRLSPGCEGGGRRGERGLWLGSTGALPGRSDEGWAVVGMYLEVVAGLCGAVA